VNVRAWLRSSLSLRRESEGRRALVAAALGAALGALVAAFARREAAEVERGWRGRSAT
jgi:uncharacterized membrane protein